MLLYLNYTELNRYIKDTIHVIFKGSFMEETLSYGLSHSHSRKDHCVQLGMCLKGS